ncbi:hypothetical protein J2S74_002975 [Evansella vedderi]|uniref:Spo0E like sporulation regulatory protein n=1 Tax=Evansella vedderi TaxID=38282 RepID=A0ABT9ZYS6_9BACI|nr:aspartyl-phosphate phosphatase Spo0E family protein [Evansella vedderi]MDQ0255593.1 hypothetical protein [Evansella vedderi]
MSNRMTNDRERFEYCREELNRLGARYGLTHPLVIEKSKQLDKMHNEIIKSGEEVITTIIKQSSPA